MNALLHFFTWPAWFDGQTYSVDRGNGYELATPAEILAATKALRIGTDRQECRLRLSDHYGDALEQVSRASGLYGATAQANHAAGVSASIAASNTARDSINAATTIAQVEAVTVSWPTLA